MSKLINKVLCVLSVSGLLASRSFAATEVLYDGMSRTVGNLTLKCMANCTANANNGSSASASTNYGQLLVTGLVGIVSTAIIGPTFKTRIIDPCWDRFASKCGVPRCCRRYSSANMDIGTDLFNPKPDRSYRLLLENLDHSLVDVGWKKYPLVDDDGHVVGYRYILSDDDHKEKASVFLVRDYQSLSAQKGLLRLNKVLRGKDFKVKTGEAIAEREIPDDGSKEHYSYTATGGRKIEREPSQISAPVFHDEKSVSMQVSPLSLSVDNMYSSEQAKTHLKKFKEAF